MAGAIADLNMLEAGAQCFPRWLPGGQNKGTEDTLDFGDPNEKQSGFSPEALPHFQAAYPDKPITEDDLFYYIYGILHSKDRQSCLEKYLLIDIVEQLDQHENTDLME